MSSTQTIEKSPISITSSALDQLKRIRKDQEINESCPLRIGVKGGGCSGFQYILGFDDLKDGDKQYDVGGLNVAIQKSHALYLIGMEIDWLNGLENRGFVFNNPNATETCGCGTSFSA